MGSWDWGVLANVVRKFMAENEENDGWWVGAV